MAAETNLQDFLLVFNPTIFRDNIEPGAKFIMTMLVELMMLHPYHFIAHLRLHSQIAGRACSARKSPPQTFVHDIVLSSC